MFTNVAESYDLKLVQSCLFLRDECPTDCVHGRFLVSLPRPASFKSIAVKLVGLFRMPRDTYLIKDDREMYTFVSEKALGSTKTLKSFQLPAGSYEFPFAIPLTGRMLETVTGPGHTYHSYKVEAIIERRFRSNSVVSQPIRIYRSPTMDVIYGMNSVPPILEGETPQNIQYSICMPDFNIPFGSKFPVKGWFAPLTKSLRLVVVKATVVERHSLRVDATAAESAMYNILVLTSMRDCTICTHEQRYSMESLDGDMTPAEWCLDLLVSLPDNFESCSQSVSTKSIKITHELVVTAEFQDTSTLFSTYIDEKIPFSIYMTPSTIGEDAVIHSQDFECLTKDEDPLPPYSCHHCDKIPTDWTVCAGQISMITAGDLIERQSAIQASGMPIISNVNSADPPAYDFNTSGQ